MRIVKNFVIGLGAVALTAGLVTVFTPRAVHAAVAALVEVSNPVTSPALTSRIDDPGRIPYAANYQCSGSDYVCTITSGPVPANHRLVIERISGRADVHGPSTGLVVARLVNSDFQNSFPTAPSVTAGGAAGDGNVLAFDQKVQLYFDQNQVYEVGFFTSAEAFNESKAFFITVTGYLLDCNAAPCAAIASF